VNLAFRNRLNVVFSKLLQSLSTIVQAALFRLPKKLKLPKLSIRTFFLCLVLLLIVMLFIVSMRHYVTAPDQFQLEIPFYISCIATICAFTAVLLAQWSLEATEKALELTRITTRPFLSCQPGDVSFEQREHMAILEFHVKNMGSVPANLVAAETAFFDDDEVIKYDNGSRHYPKERQQPKDTVIFPGAVYNLVQKFDLRHNIDKKLFDNIVNGTVKVRFRMTYSAQSMEYITVQTEKLEKAERGLINRVPIQPQKWT